MRQRKSQQRPASVQLDDSGSSADKRAPNDQPEDWRLEAAIVSLLTLTDDENRLICPPFRVLPTPEEFPLYFEHIQKPIDLKTIAERCRDQYYNSWATLDADIQLMCNNAKEFNEPSSQVHKDANRLLQHFQLRAKELTEVRRFSQRVLNRNKEILDELLRSIASEEDQFSEDSEEDEDSEESRDPKWRLYWAIRNYGLVNGVPLCENFMELPSKRSYPDYYEEISRPMSLYMINKKLKRGVYTDMNDLILDLIQIYDNACSYNIEESEIYVAAQNLRKLTLQRAKELDSTLGREVEDEKRQSPSTINGSPATVTKKRKRTDNNTNHTPTCSSTNTNFNSHPKKPGRKSVDELRGKFANKLNEVLRDVRELKIGDRILSDPFLYLPCDKTFPDYYKIIAQPISLTCIQNKIQDSRYADSDEMMRDLRQMFDNARTYNKIESQIWNDATILESVATGSMKSRTGGTTLFYPYRRSDKGWTEEASIEKSPLKSKKKALTEGSDKICGTTPKPVPNGQSNAHFQVQPPSQASVASSHSVQKQQQIATNGIPQQTPTTQFISAASSSTPGPSSSSILAPNLGYSSGSAAHPAQLHAQTSTTAAAMAQQQQAGSSNSQVSQQVQIDAGRTVVQAPRVEPIFVEPSGSLKVQRALHSEAYVRYIESLYNTGKGRQQRTVSKWDTNLQASQRNTVSIHRTKPYEWIKQGSNGLKPKEDEIVRALWKLRDHLVEGTTGVQRIKAIDPHLDVAVQQNSTKR